MGNRLDFRHGAPDLFDNGIAAVHRTHHDDMVANANTSVSAQIAHESHG